MAERVCRVSEAIENKERQKTGRTARRRLSPRSERGGVYPPVGSQCNLSENKYISNMPTQKEGAVMPTLASTVIAESIHLPRLSAHVIPKRTPKKPLTKKARKPR